MALLVTVAVVGAIVVGGATYAVTTRPSFTTPEAVVAPPAGVRSRFRRSRDVLAAEWSGLGAYLVLVAAGIGALITAFWAIGRLVEHGTLIDRPVFHWVLGHQGHRLTDVMKVLTLYGNKPQVWYGAVALGVLATLGELLRHRPRPLLPALQLLLLCLTVHYVNLWVAAIIKRPPVPYPGGGAFPSGGCARAVVVYGFGVYLAVRAWGLAPRLRAAAYSLAGAMAFLEAFSRVYLNKHWLLDAVGGALEGLALLVIFIAAGTAANNWVAPSSLRDHVTSGDEPLRVGAHGHGGDAARPA